MKVKRMFKGRKKKKETKEAISKKKDAVLNNEAEESTVPSNNSGDTLDLASTFSSEEGNQQRSNDIVLRKYSENVDGSAMAAFARMSTTIAQTLSEKEFGSQENSLYRPNSNSYTSKVVHPVLCKRDIFVQSVTPTKTKDKRNKKISIYHVENKSSYMDYGEGDKENSKFYQDKHKSMHGRKELPIQEEQASGSSDEEATNDLSHGDGTSNLAAHSISASMLFREKKQLSVETGRITSDDNQAVPINPHRLHYVQSSDYPTTLRHGRPPRFTPVSPSSTVSSLTIPAELDLDPTPRALFHRSMKSPPKLEGIQELSDNDHVVMSQRYPIDDDDYHSEI